VNLSLAPCMAVRSPGDSGLMSLLGSGDVSRGLRVDLCRDNITSMISGMVRLLLSHMCVVLLGALVV
jgi:hypothetical protein